MNDTNGASEMMQRLIGQQVRVWTEGGSAAYTDEGVLVACDAQWLCVRNGGGDVLYFPIQNVRLVKPQGRAAADPATDTQKRRERTGPAHF